MNNEELHQRLRWLVRLRWIGIVAVLAATHLVRIISFLAFPLAPAYAILGCAALYNAVIQYRLSMPGGDLLRLSLVQFLLDQLALTAAVYFSGGCDSPFIFFFIFHVVISGAILPGSYAYLFGALAVLLPGAVMALKHWGVLPHFGIFRDEPLIFSDMTVMGSYGSVYVGTVGLTAYFTTYLSTRLHQSREALRKSNVKLSTLLDASRLTTSTLELEKVLSTSLRIILNVTNLKAGIVLLLEEGAERACHEFYGCKAQNCPAYKSSVNCWQLAGTMCHGDGTTCPQGKDAEACWREQQVHTHGVAAVTFEDKIHSCSRCEFFTNVILIPKMASGFGGHDLLSQKVRIEGGMLHRALVMGRTVVDYSRNNPLRVPIDTVTEIAMPLKMQDQILGIFYLVSDSSIPYSAEETEFFQFLSEIVASGIFNSRIYEDVEESYLQTVMAMENAIEARDPYTRGHSKRVAELCAEVSEGLHLSAQERDHLRFAALLHDVGKIGIGKEILQKPSALTEEEERRIRVHADLGAQILDPVHFLRPVIPAIRHHHENFDGSGYPRGVAGREIPLKARIIKIADAWDAMRSDRPYRRALSEEQALQELRTYAGIQFDPDIVDVFVRCVVRGSG